MHASAAGQATFALLMISCSRAPWARWLRWAMCRCQARRDRPKPGRTVPALGLYDDAADPQEGLGQRWVTR
jgi:hypothetical protein